MKAALLLELLLATPIDDQRPQVVAAQTDPANIVFTPPMVAAVYPDRSAPGASRGDSVFTSPFVTPQVVAALSDNRALLATRAESVFATPLLATQVFAAPFDTRPPILSRAESAFATPRPSVAPPAATFPDSTQRTIPRAIDVASVVFVLPRSTAVYPDSAPAAPRAVDVSAFTLQQTPFVSASYPDCIAQTPVKQSVALGFVPPPLFVPNSSYPDQAARAQAQDTSPVGFAGFPQPTPFAFYPDRAPPELRRQDFVANILFPELPPEELEFWQPVYPDRPLPAKPQDTSTPFVLVPPPLLDASYPDRAALAKAQDTNSSFLAPLLLPPSASYPDHVPIIRQQDFVTQILLLPPEEFEFWHPVFPDQRPPAKAQDTNGPFAIAPMAAPSASYPDSAPFVRARAEDFATAVLFQPAVFSSFPDASLREFKRSTDQSFVVAFTPLPTSSYPDLVPQQRAQQVDVFVTPQRPIEWQWANYPDAVPKLPRPQDFVTEFPIEEEKIVPLLVQASFPDRVLHLISRAQDFNVPFVPVVPPPPPPPPPPPKPVRPLVPLETGGRGATFTLPPICPPGQRLVWSQERWRWVCVPNEQADYALLPLAPEISVVALADGTIDTFVDEKGGLVVRLTADDSTIYYYAKVKGAKDGRVRKGDAIGTSMGPAIAPKALPASKPTTTDTEQKSTEVPPPVFGVLPVAPPLAPEPQAEPAPPLPPAPAPAPAQVLAATPPPPRALATPSAGTVIVVGAVIIGLALGAAWLMKRAQQSTPKRKPKRRNKRKRRRQHR